MITYNNNKQQLKKKLIVTAAESGKVAATKAKKIENEQR